MRVIRLCYFPRPVKQDSCEGFPNSLDINGGDYSLNNYLVHPQIIWTRPMRILEIQGPIFSS